MLGWALSAYAGNEVGVVVTGEGAMVPQTLAAVEGWLTQHGRVVIAAPLPPDAISELLTCFVIGHLNCARDIIDARARSGTVIYAEVDARPGTRDITLTVYWFDKGRAGFVERSACERCSNEALGSATNDLLTKLTHAAGSAGGPGRPDQAEIAAVPLTDKRPARPGRSRVLPLMAMATGAATVITGGVLIAIDREPGRHAPQRIYTTAPAGAGLSIAGAVAAGLGAYLWLRAPELRSSPVAALTADAAYLGWLSRF